MTTIAVASYTDGTLKELLTDAVSPPQHQTYDTDGVTLLSTVDASAAEVDMLRLATPPRASATAPLSGSGPPLDSLGADGDTYIDVDSNFAYGPKAGGVWPVGATVQLPRA